MILFEHTTPTAVAIAGLVLVAGAGAVSVWRHLARSRGNALLVATYAVVIALLAWCTLLPGRRDNLTRLHKPKFAIALDTSESMTLQPLDGAPNRWETAQRALALPGIATLAEECDVEVFPFAETVADPVSVSGAAALEPTGASTHVRDALMGLAGRLSGLNVTGVLLLSDGRDTREAFNDWTADDRPFPIYAARLEPPGLWQRETEVRIDTVSTPRRVSVDWQSECTVRLSGQGTGANVVVVQLFRNGTLVDERPTRIPAAGGEQEVAFDLQHDRIGVFNYRVLVPPLAGEANTNDNEYAVSVQVTDARNRLLYVEGAPRWEYKFLRRVLLAQPNVSPVIFYAGPDGAPHPGNEHHGITADMTAAQLAYFKIVILGNLSAPELGVERAARLVDFVNDGGSLIVLGGSRAWGDEGLAATALRDVLPVRGRAEAPYVGDNPFPVTLTDAARSHPAFASDAQHWSSIPAILSVFPGPTLAPAAQALVTADTPRGPLLVVATQRSGQGKVAAILTDSLWKWQLSPTAGQNDPYPRFWSQMISWLLPEEEGGEQNAVQLYADREQLYLGEEIELTARIAAGEPAGATAVRAALTFPDQREVTFDMAAQPVTTAGGKTFSGHVLHFAAREPGLYIAVAEMDTSGETRRSEPVSFYVKPYSPETIPQPIDDGVLRTLAETSGGQYLETLDDLDRTLTDIRPQAVEEASAEFTTLWRNGPTMLAIVTLLIASWTTRKLRGMP